MVASFSFSFITAKIIQCGHATHLSSHSAYVSRLVAYQNIFASLWSISVIVNLLSGASNLLGTIEYDFPTYCILIASAWFLAIILFQNMTLVQSQFRLFFRISRTETLSSKRVNFRTRMWPVWLNLTTRESYLINSFFAVCISISGECLVCCKHPLFLRAFLSWIALNLASVNKSFYLYKIIFSYSMVLWTPAGLPI